MWNVIAESLKSGKVMVMGRCYEKDIAEQMARQLDTHPHYTARYHKVNMITDEELTPELKETIVK